MSLPPIGGKVFAVQRTVELGTLSSGAADRAGVYSFELDDFPSSTEFSSLFQFWRVKSITLTFSFRNSIAVSAGTTVWYPTLYISNNSDASYSAASSKNDILQRPYRRYQLNGTRSLASFTVKPTAFLSSDSGVVTRMPAGFWNTCANVAGTQVSYYGFGLWVDDYNTTLGNGSCIEVTAIANFEFRGPK